LDVREKGIDMSELSLYELEAQYGELLPQREALGVFGSFNLVVAKNSATAVQLLAVHSTNKAIANQTIIVGSVVG
jgi:hypothetical protein